VAACLAATLLAACSSSGGGSTSSELTNPSTPTSPPTSPSLSASTSESTSPNSDATTDQNSSAGTGDAAPVTVNKTIDDTVLGNKATIIKYISGYQPSAGAKQRYATLADAQVVLVDVKVTASSKYYDTVGAGSFYLTGTPDGIDQASTTILDDDLKTAGYPPLQDAETGKTTTGWIVFTPHKEDAGKLVLRFKRIAAKTSEGQNIPAKNFDIPLS
jgi:hypothetical protein